MHQRHLTGILARTTISIHRGACKKMDRRTTSEVFRKSGQCQVFAPSKIYHLSLYGHVLHFVLHYIVHRPFGNRTDTWYTTRSMLEQIKMYNYSSLRVLTVLEFCPRMNEYSMASVASAAAASCRCCTSNTSCTRTIINNRVFSQ